jgi:hypothetical protein
MTVRAIKKFTKTSSQDWSGVYIKNINSTISSTPDPRDQETMYSNTEIVLIRDNIRENIKNAPGYEGWDREYVGNNELRLIYYFSDRILANTFIHASPTPNKNVRETFINSVIKQKPTNYNSQWILIDENGQEEVITVNNV